MKTDISKPSNFSRQPLLRLASVLCLLCLSAEPTASAAEALAFKPSVIAEDANMWWARALGDLNGDGFLDVALQDNNAHGGWLGWLECRNQGAAWQRHLIARQAPGGGQFACGDLDLGDIDRDGDLDVLGFEHPGEWDQGGAPTDIFWFANPDWKPQRIGQAPNFIKDVNLVDFNGDDRLDLVAACFESSRLVIFRQDTPNQWTKVQELKIENLHEGMDVGDIDGDGDADVAANGYWIQNPGGKLTEAWIVRSIDAKWHQQNGDWSRNATKTFCRDINADGRAEIFISHSERSGYPVSWYGCPDPKRGNWTEHRIANELAAAHTLQVYDFDLDGDFDVLTGVNRNRAKALAVDPWPVSIYLNAGNGIQWKAQRLTDQGIYNGQVGDFDCDGDLDIFRLSTHDGQRFEVLINQIRP